ncbi:MAG: hypothetical protein IKA83_09215 [Paludibacteraceae bacterium]|nr:hypothetical protein [Paludibacteraceae bacterium]
MQELEQAKSDIDNHKLLYNIKIKKMIKKQRSLLYMTSLRVLISVVSYINYKIANNPTIDLQHISMIMTTISLFMTILSMTLALLIRFIRIQVPDKKKSVDLFMCMWYDFEWALKEKFMIQYTTKMPSWINVTQFYLSNIDTTYPQKSKDFYDVLNIRNKIAHGDINSINNDQLIEAIKIITKLNHNLKKNKISQIID